MAQNLDRSLRDLNPPQREAVLHETGPLLVVAGPGSGKTRVITHRVAQLYRHGYSPESVLAITFTNKAAQEMRERTEAISGIATRWISTFHSFGARMLRRHIGRLDPYDSSFTIYDQDDCRGLLKAILKERSVDAAMWSPAPLQSAISQLKNDGSTPAVNELSGIDYRERLLAELFDAYESRLRELNAVDFDDLLLLTVRLLETDREILERYRERFQQVLIDEYQDTNALQYRLAQLLVERHRNLCVTGDPDQSIYRWRGADIGNILRFESDYPDARVIKLEQNYRSTRCVLAAANAIIANNVERKEKHLWSERETGDPVEVCRFADEREEACAVANVIDRLRGDGARLGDIAVFYRVNSLSRPIEQELVTRGTPYSMVGGVEFYLRREVKDLLAYLSALANPRDDESLKRIINVPLRGIGKGSIAKLEARARERGLALGELIASPDELDFLRGRARAGCEQLAGLLAELRDDADASVAMLFDRVVKATDYREFLETQHPGDYLDRWENVDELIKAADEFQSLRDEDGAARDEAPTALVGFLEQARLLGETDRWSAGTDSVTLMTLHAAKGLEFPNVIIIGAEDGILPLVRSDDVAPDIEEERRLCYVGITRAEDRLYLTHAAKRTRFGQPRPAVPSRFLGELREGALATADTAFLAVDPETTRAIERKARLESISGDDVDFEYADSGSDEGDAAETDPWDELEFAAESLEEPFRVGDRVYHDDYGEGTILRVAVVGRRRSVTIDFDAAGEKQIFPAFVTLRRVL